MVPTLGSLAGIELHDHQERNPTDQVCASVKTRQITGRHSSRSTRVLPSRANTKPAPGSLSAAHLDQRVRCECEHLAVQLTTEKLFSSKSPPPREHTVTHGEPSWPRHSPNRRPHLLGGGWGWREEPAPRERKKKTTASPQVSRLPGWPAVSRNSTFESHPCASTSPFAHASTRPTPTPTQLIPVWSCQEPPCT